MRTLWILVIGVVLVGACAGCGGAPSEAHWTGQVMGTTYSVKVVGLPAEPAPAKIAAEVDRRIQRINDLMSTYREDSELSRFNRSEAGEWYRVSEDTAIVVAGALTLCLFTGGAVDITVGPLVNLWSFGPEPHSGPERVPSDEEIAAAQERCGIKKINVKLDPATNIATMQIHSIAAESKCPSDAL